MAPNVILNTAKDLRIRFLQPAKGFYNQLMDTFLIYKSNNENNDVRKNWEKKLRINYIIKTFWKNRRIIKRKNITLNNFKSDLRKDFEQRL